MKATYKFSALLSLIGAMTATADLRAQPAPEKSPLFLTATNGATNFLAVVDPATRQVTYVPTGGEGGASGNAGGVAVSGGLAAVVNFGSSTVTIFVRHGNHLQVDHTIKTASKPLSVAFGHGHLLVLGATTAESFPLTRNSVAPNSDGVASLLKGDGSAAQIVAYDGGAVYTEKSGAVGLLSFGVPGLVGPSVPLTIPPAPNNDTPFGLVGRGANVYVTIAHSNLEVLVRDGKIVSMAAGPSPYKDQAGAFLHAPCWNALSGQFLFSSDSPGKQLFRYLVSDNNIFFDKAVAPQLAGPPTDLDIQGNLLGVIDGGDSVTSNVSLLDIDSEGELKLRFAVKIPGPINGAAFIQ